MNTINYKNWAFRFMIWIIIINIISFYLTISYTSLFHARDGTLELISYLIILAAILLLLCLGFIIVSSIKKEQKNYKYWFAIGGIILFGLLPIITSAF